MATANITSSASVPTVDHVENATCLIGYEGLSCERCSKGKMIIKLLEEM